MERIDYLPLIKAHAAATCIACSTSGYFLEAPRFTRPARYYAVKVDSIDMDAQDLKQIAQCKTDTGDLLNRATIINDAKDLLVKERIKVNFGLYETTVKKIISLPIKCASLDWSKKYHQLLYIIVLEGGSRLQIAVRAKEPDKAVYYYSSNHKVIDCGLESLDKIIKLVCSHEQG